MEGDEKKSQEMKGNLKENSENDPNNQKEDRNQLKSQSVIDQSTLQSNLSNILGKRKGENEDSLSNEWKKYENWQVPPPSSLHGRNSSLLEVRSVFDWNSKSVSGASENSNQNPMSGSVSSGGLGLSDFGSFAGFGGFPFTMSKDSSSPKMRPPTPPKDKPEDFSKLFDNSVCRNRRGSLQSDLKFAVSSTQGRRKTQEDTFDVVHFSSKRDTPESSPHIMGSEGEREEDIQEINVPTSSENEQAITQIEEKADYAFFAVYDGHGGNQAAEFTAKTMQNAIVDHPEFSKDTKKAILEGFDKTESDFEKHSKENKIHGGVGTTACVAIITGTTLYVANTGDSAAILCRRGQPLMLTTPHTPKTESERDRVLSVGGVVKKDRLGHPSWNASLVNLGVTRAIGDFYFKSIEWTEGKASGLIATPEISEIQLTTDDYFLLLASDGFWDVVSTQQAVNYILQQSSTEDVDTICNQLIELALKKATEDNTTVLLIKLRELEVIQTAETNIGNNLVNETITGTVAPVLA